MDAMEVFRRIIIRDAKDAAAVDEDTKSAKTHELWVRLRLKDPQLWVAGKLENLGDELLDSPFPGSDALWLTGVVQCNPETGEWTFGDKEGNPLLRANYLAVRWADIQVLELISSDMIKAMKDAAPQNRGRGFRFD